MLPSTRLYAAVAPRFRDSVPHLLSLTAALVLSACGGGGGGVDAGGGGSASTPVISGVAAIGAPVPAANITVFDAKGAQVGSGVSGANGKFSIALDKAGTAPYVLKLVKDEISLYALHPKALSGTANITPLSDAVAAMASPTGAAEGLIDAMKASVANAPTAESIDARQGLVSAAIAPVKAAAGATADLFKETFTADGTGADKVLDSISVTRVADGEAKSASVQIAFKLATNPENADSAPPVINLTSKSSLNEVQAEAAKVGTLSADDLAAKEASDLYNGLLANLNRCYAEKPDVRTNLTDTVKSANCKKVFLDNDPAQYLNFGQRVRKGEQFSGMFTYSGEVTFLPVDKSYLVQDLKGLKSADRKGRAIVALSWINEDGNRENIMLYVTRYTLNGEDLLGLSGDRNRYPVSVVSFNQKREFPLRGASLPNLDYVQSSYLIAIRDVPAVDGNRSKIDYVSMTSPSGKTILLASAPGGAARDLAICSSSEVILDSAKVPTTPKTRGLSSGRYECTGTSKSITMAQRFVDSAETRVPSDIYGAGILRPLDETGTPYTPKSEDLKKFPSTGLWKMRVYFLNDPMIEQRTWSVARPMTAEELLGPQGPDAVMPRYTSASLLALKALKESQATALQPCWPDSGALCDPTQSPVPAPAAGGFPFAWTTGSKVPVTSIWASGRRNDSSKSFISNFIGSSTPQVFAPTWDDQLTVLSTASEAKLRCSRQSDSDSHCATGVTVGALGDFNVKSWMSYSELWGKDSEQRNLTRSYNWYQPRKNAANDPF